MRNEADEAARRTAINLMRLNEGLEMREAHGYSQAIGSNNMSYRAARFHVLRKFYEDWFQRAAR